MSTAVRTDATAPALKEVLSELDGLAGNKPLSDAEIAVAIGAEAKEYPDEFASPQSIAGALGEMAEYQLPPDYLDTFLDRLQSTKAADIGRTMAEVVAKSERVTLVVGDRKNVEPKLRAMGFDKIVPITYDGNMLGD